MSTDTIRERSTAALAEALHTANGSGCLHEDGYGGTGWVQCDKEASWAMECSPTLARRLDFGTAWDEAVAALPEGWAINMLWGTTTKERWGAHAGPFPAVAGTYHDSETAGGDTPTDALVALAEALRERAR